MPELDLNSERQQVHFLLDALPDAKVPAVRGMLEAMLDPVSIALANAPIDDEPLTVEEIKALDESREWLRHNAGIPHEWVLAELGITQDEIDNFKEPQ